MRFLIVTKGNKHLVPPDVLLGMVEAFDAWNAKYADQTEQNWGFAGQPSGGGIVDVDPLETLDAMMTEFPFAILSDIEIYPLVDLPTSLGKLKENLQQMMQGMQG